jgi:hypothetical protein
MAGSPRLEDTSAAMDLAIDALNAMISRKPLSGTKLAYRHRWNSFQDAARAITSGTTTLLSPYMAMQTHPSSTRLRVL